MPQDLQLLLRRSILHRRRIEEDDQDPRPLDVTKELVAETFPDAAPSMRPGMSAMTNSRPSKLTTPRFGTSVVNG